LLGPLTGPQTMVVTLQNGLGNEEQLARFIPPAQILGGLCFVCLNRIAPGVILHTAHGKVVLGEFQRPSQPRTHALAALFRQAGISCDVTEDLARTHWEKLVWNIPFSGLSVYAGGIATDRIVADPALRAFAVDLMAETLRAAAACGVELDPRSSGRNMAQTESMGAYRPSMLVDFLLGRPLELEAIVAEPLRRGEAAGAHLPRMRELLEGIRARI